MVNRVEISNVGERLRDEMERVAFHAPDLLFVDEARVAAPEGIERGSAAILVRAVESKMRK